MFTRCAFCFVVLLSTWTTISADTFTWQGRLLDGGAPVNGSADLKFRLYDDATLGGPVGTEQVVSDVLVTDGQLTIDLDFGSVFDGTNLWMEIDVRTPHDPTDTAPYTPLSPRQPINAVPYAFYAMSVDSAAVPFTYSGPDAVFTGGYVGIGTTTPAHPLHVVGDEIGRVAFIENVNSTLNSLALWARGASYGLRGSTTATNGTGVHAFAESSSAGVSRALAAHNNDPNGWAGYFTGAKTYFGEPVGIGITTPTSPLHVVGDVPTVIYGYNSSVNPTNIAVLGSSPSGIGVKGLTTNPSGSTIGVFGESHSTSGRAVWAFAGANSGTNFAVKAHTNSPDGYAGYFTGGRNYFEGNVGIGKTAPAYPLHVLGDVRIEGTPGVTGLVFPDGTTQTSAGGPSTWLLNGSAAYYDAGNVGIGTSTPSSKLEVTTDLFVAGRFQSTHTSAGTGVLGDGLGLSIGVRGQSEAGYGVYGSTDSAGQSGVRGVNTSPTGFGAGVDGISYGFGYGVEGIGVNFGVWGKASAGEGTSIGVRGDVVSPDGYAGYFTGGRNYFQGNVGIGTTAPDALLKVVSQTTNAGDNTAAFHAPNIGPNPSHIHWGTDGDWYIRSASATGRVILQDLGGNVGVGTTAPATKLDVAGTGRFDPVLVVQNPGHATEGGQLVLGDPGASIVGEDANSWNIDVNETYLRFFRGGGTVAMNMTADGHVGIGATNPVLARLTVVESEASGRAIIGTSGVPAAFGGAIGVEGSSWSNQGQGIRGRARSNVGTNYGVRGDTDSPDGYAGYFTGNSSNVPSLYVEHPAADPPGASPAIAAIEGINNDTIGEGVGVSGTGGRIGIYGESTVSGGWGLYGKGQSEGVRAEGDYGGRLLGGTVGAYGSGATYGIFSQGNAHIAGTLSKSGGAFRIDHPLDPENKELWHSFVESPDMKNIYDGVAVLNSYGRAIVELPDYFDALNRDFRYQLTPIGAPMRDLYIASKVSNNRFEIAGGKPGMEVSWQVTGIRQDPFAEANRIPNEVEKTDEDKGKYLHPDIYGAPPEQGVYWKYSAEAADAARGGYLQK